MSLNDNLDKGVENSRDEQLSASEIRLNNP